MIILLVFIVGVTTGILGNMLCNKNDKEEL